MSASTLGRWGLCSCFTAPRSDAGSAAMIRAMSGGFGAITSTRGVDSSFSSMVGFVSTFKGFNSQDGPLPPCARAGAARAVHRKRKASPTTDNDGFFQHAFPRAVCIGSACTSTRLRSWNAIFGGTSETIGRPSLTFGYTHGRKFLFRNGRRGILLHLPDGERWRSVAVLLGG